jgi:cytidylate kinase
MFAESFDLQLIPFEDVSMLPGHKSASVLVISGSMGSGKTTVLGEASDILREAGIPHAAIDLDALGVSYLPQAAEDDLMMRNLTAVWNTYAAAGISRLLIADAVDSLAAYEDIRRAVPDAEFIVCRLRASLDTMRQRIRVREPGMLQKKFVTRVAELEASLDAARIEDFSVDNDSRSVTDVAREMLVRAGWL